MDEEQKRASEQYAGNFGAREFIRYSCASLSFLLVGLALSMILHNSGISIIFIGLFFGILWLAPYWPPAYALVRKVMGNPNLPPALPAGHRKWWDYIPMVIKLALVLVVLDMGIQSLLQGR